VTRASRLSSVGTLAAGIAHEIRNPLVAVRTFLELFPQRKNDEEFLTTFQQLSLKEVDRITRLITELLTFARTHERTLSQIDVGEVTQHVAALLQPEAGKRTVNLMLSCARDVPAVEGDPSQLQQVILNLVLNAIEASPPGGTVTVLVQPGRTLRGEPQVRIEVTDEGPGVPREHREAIFTPFFTTKDTGTGLGLAVAHQIVVEHGGTLTVNCPKSGGSTFVVTLPIPSATAGAKERHLRVVNG
jgi:two-component system sensor histidine kinase HydH